MSINEFFDKVNLMALNGDCSIRMTTLYKCAITMHIVIHHVVVNEIMFNYGKETEDEFFVRLDATIKKSHDDYKNMMTSLKMRPLEIVEG